MANERHEGPMWMLGIDNLSSFSQAFREDSRFVDILGRMGLPAAGPYYPTEVRG